MGTQLRRYKPETITRALVALRAELIREGGPGLEHVEALLVLRGSNLPPVPRKLPMRFKRNGLRRAIREALRPGPLTGRELVQRVSDATGVPYGELYRSLYAQLHVMRERGQVTHDHNFWLLPRNARPHFLP